VTPTRTPVGPGQDLACHPGPGPSLPPRRRSPVVPVAGAILLAALWLSSRDTGLTPASGLRAIPAFFRFLAGMWPPDFHDLGGLARAGLFTMEIALLGTALSVAFSLPLAVLAARNFCPNPAVRGAVRAVILVCRAIPDFVFALMFISAVGLGPVPGVLGLAVHSVGMLAKVYAERIEEIDPGPVEALAGLGGTRLQVLRLAVLPDVLPNLAANTLFRFDINIRSSLVLGLVGAGGIGYELITALQALEFRRALAVIIVILVMVAAVETVSDRIRRRLI
jgi:phosphonate transport system permease protein